MSRGHLKMPVDEEEGSSHPWEEIDLYVQTLPQKKVEQLARLAAKMPRTVQGHAAMIKREAGRDPE